MELVLVRPFSFPNLTGLWSLIKSIFLEESDDDEIITDLNAPHYGDGEADDEKRTTIAGGDDTSPDGNKDDDDDDEDDAKKRSNETKAREEKFQTKYQKAMKAIKKSDPDLYQSLKDGTEPTMPKHDYDDPALDDLRGGDLIKTIVSQVTANVNAANQAERHKDKVDRATKAWNAEAEEAREVIAEAQETLGLTDAQAKEAFAYAKDLGLDTPMRIATATMTYMKTLQPGAPQTTKERVDEAKRQRDALLAGQPKKTTADPKPRKKSNDQTILDEMKAIKPKDAMDLLDSSRKKK